MPINTDLLKKQLRYTTYVDKFKHHNQMINFMDKFHDNESFPKILINFDLHSDVKVRKTCNVNGISNWVNHTFAKFGITDYYWVVPTHVLNDEKMTNELFNNTETVSSFMGNFTQTPYTDFSKPLKQSFLINTKNNKISKESANYTEEEIQKILSEDKEKYKLINIYTCTAENLPDFLNDDVLVSVDGDYFSNNGYDTVLDYTYEPEKIEDEFNQFIECLNKKNIFPIYMGLCLSGDYIDKIESTENFYDVILKNQKCPIKFNIVYDYTDVKSEKYEYTTSNFYCFDKLIEVLHQDIDSLDENKIIDLFKLKDKDLENGFYTIYFYVKTPEMNKDNSKIKIYKYEFELEKIGEYNSDIHFLINKLNNKIKNLQEQSKNAE